MESAKYSSRYSKYKKKCKTGYAPYFLGVQGQAISSSVAADLLDIV